jgi:NAD(P)-dependent dehydrogenase (short-subunit alcohol dehydrogenase family)
MRKCLLIALIPHNARRLTVSGPRLILIGGRPVNYQLAQDQLKAVWDTNVFGALAVYQALLPLLRESSDARIVNVSSGVGSLTSNANHPTPTTRPTARCTRHPRQLSTR